jgi:hypothetical protein
VTSPQADPDGPGPGGEEERRRLRQKVFGDVLPDTTADEREHSTGERREGNEEWLRSNVPPHHS